MDLKNIRTDKPEDRVNVTAGVKAACDTIKECVLATEVWRPDPFSALGAASTDRFRPQASEPNAEGHRVCTEEDSKKARAAMADLLQVPPKPLAASILPSHLSSRYER